MKILLFGATGMVGDGVLRWLCVSPQVNRVVRAFRSGPRVVDVQGTVSEKAAIQSLDCLCRLRLVGHLDECATGEPGLAIQDDVDLHRLSVGFEQAPNVLVCHVRTQVSNN